MFSEYLVARMGSLSCCLVVLVSYCSIQVVLVAAGGGAEIEVCTMAKSLRLTSYEVIMENGTIKGRVQVCEDHDQGTIWKNLCDTDWTKYDAEVACRSLNYSSTGAQNFTTKVVIGGTDSTMEVKCNGSESHISVCEYRSNNIMGNCMYNTELQCKNDTSTDSTSQTSSTFATTSSSFATTSVPTSVSNTQQPPSASTMNINATTSPPPSDSESESSNSILKPPNLYYFLIGVAAVILAIMLLLLVIIMFCCCGRPQLKGISPYDIEKQDGFIKEKDSTLCLEVPDEESTKIKDDLMHHQLQQSGPIYEAIQSTNESSSTPHSQESPSSRSAIVAINGPPLPPSLQGSELYSVLNSTDTYSQLEVHIPTSTPTRTEPPNSDSDYQQLDYKTSSLKRHRVPNTHAVNRNAVAIAQGLLEEEEFLEQENGTPRHTSYSLPNHTSLSSHRPPLLHNRSLERPNLEVQLRVDDEHSNNVDINSEQENFYQTIESPPDYASLEELDEVSEISTNDMYKDAIASHGYDEVSEISTNDMYKDAIASHGYENSMCSSHPLTHHSPECPSNSGLVPSLHTNSQSSITCSLTSSSTQMIGKKYMENSELHLGNCPVIACSKPNGLPGHFDNTGVQPDHSDRYTLV